MAGIASTDPPSSSPSGSPRSMGLLKTPTLLGVAANNISNLSLPAIPQSGESLQVRVPLQRSRSSRSPEISQVNASSLGQTLQRQRGKTKAQSENDRADALWVEMQATLAEVELSAARGAHFFGPQHSAALDELRMAQIALAQAWARSEADEVAENRTASAATSNKSPRASIHGDKEAKDDGAEDPEGDIAMAKKRREANDKYFGKVNNGVLDVVGRLEEVAMAMGKVEQESREVWSESDGLETDSSPH